MIWIVIYDLDCDLHWFIRQRTRFTEVSDPSIVLDVLSFEAIACSKVSSTEQICIIPTNSF